MTVTRVLGLSTSNRLIVQRLNHRPQRPSCCSIKTAILPSRPARAHAVARSSSPGCPQGIAVGGAQRPGRLQARRHSHRRDGRQRDPDRCQPPRANQDASLRRGFALPLTPRRERSASYWKPSTPSGSIPHPVGDGSRFANADYLPDYQGQRGTEDFQVRNPGPLSTPKWALEPRTRAASRSNLAPPERRQPVAGPRPEPRADERRSGVILRLRCRGNIGVHVLWAIVAPLVVVIGCARAALMPIPLPGRCPVTLAAHRH